MVINLVSSSGLSDFVFAETSSTFVFDSLDALIVPVRVLRRPYRFGQHASVRSPPRSQGRDQLVSQALTSNSDILAREKGQESRLEFARLVQEAVTRSLSNRPSAVVVVMCCKDVDIEATLRQKCASQRLGACQLPAFRRFSKDSWTVADIPSLLHAMT